MHFLMAMIFHSLIPFITSFRYDIQETAFYTSMMLFYFDVHPFTKQRRNCQHMLQAYFLSSQSLEVKV